MFAVLIRYIGGVEFPYGPGDVVCDRFDIQKVLGTPGQMAYAVKATDALTGESVVLKILHATSTENVLLAQYQRLRAIDSKRLARALAYFEHEDAGTKEPILVLEYIEGQTLAQWLPGRAVRERMQVLEEVAAALADLDEQDLSHGDLHDENILLTSDNRLVLIDPQAGTFGSTRVRNLTASSSQTDRKAFLLLVDDLFQANEQAMEPIVYLLNESAEISFRTIANQIAGLLGSRHVPGEITGTITDLAKWNRQDVARRRELYRSFLDTRHAIFAALAGLVQPLAEGLSLAVGLQTADWDRARADELATIAQPRGRFQRRAYWASTDDGDTMHLTIESASDFKRPFFDPSRPDLVGRGSVTVVTADSILLASEPLEYSWIDNVPKVWSVRLDRRDEFDGARLDRMLRVLCGARYAVFPTAEEYKTDRLSPSKFNLDVILPSEMNLRAAPERRLGADGLRYGIELALTMPRSAGLGLDLFRFLGTPGGIGPSQLADVKKAFLELFGKYFDCIYELDLAVSDPGKRLVKVDLEARPAGESWQTWSYDIVCETHAG